MTDATTHQHNKQRVVENLNGNFNKTAAEIAKIQLQLDSTINGQHTQVAAELETAKYHFANRTVYAPSDGYVANLQLRPGLEARFKTPVLTFVSSEDQWIVAEFVVVLRIDGDFPDNPLRFGAAGIAAIYIESAPDALIFLRKIELQSESFLNFVYNPFK